MAMCLYEVWLLLALAVLLDCSLLQLKIEDSGYLTGIIWSQLIEIQSWQIFMSDRSRKMFLITCRWFPSVWVQLNFLSLFYLGLKGGWCSSCCYPPWSQSCRHHRWCWTPRWTRSPPSTPSDPPWSLYWPEWRGSRRCRRRGSILSVESGERGRCGAESCQARGMARTSALLTCVARECDSAAAAVAAGEPTAGRQSAAGQDWQRL